MPGALVQAAPMMQQLDPALPPKQVLAALDAPVRRLVAVVKTLYAGSWDDCAEDIRRRRAGRPYLFKLSLGLDDELDWLHRLRTYEAARGEAFAVDDELARDLNPDQHREDHR